jgi:hypothetical protein
VGALAVFVGLALATTSAQIEKPGGRHSTEAGECDRDAAGQVSLVA